MLDIGGWEFLVVAFVLIMVESSLTKQPWHPPPHHLSSLGCQGHQWGTAKYPCPLKKATSTS